MHVFFSFFIFGHKLTSGRDGVWLRGGTSIWNLKVIVIRSIVGEP